ncbi:MAG: FlgD immunoglobulin-like domain containing protein [bacterium]
MKVHHFLSLLFTFVSILTVHNSKSGISGDSAGAEIVIRPDTLFFETIYSVDSLWVINVGNEVLNIDSVLSHKPYGWSVEVTTRDTFFTWFIYGKDPSQFEINKLTLAANDSALLVFYPPDLCPVCKQGMGFFPFTDTLFFYNNDTLRNPVRIFAFGEGLPSAVEKANPRNPQKFALLQNYPNPFNPTTTIQYHLPQTGKVTLRIYNILGELVQTLADEVKQPGVYKIAWDGKNSQGHDASTGLYVVRMVAGDFMQSKKLVYLK